MELKYHHLGIPTDEVRDKETYLEKSRVFISGYEGSDYGIEWLRFEEDSELPEVVQKLPHIAFEVDDVHEAIKGKKVIIEPNSPSEGVLCAFIIDNGAPIEFIKVDSEKDTLFGKDTDA
ncbi:MAG: hypothetical protein JW738_02840 [Actinobacteria bacterium]|nr:hypothetical protein [Actinomycetota bacterium]